MKTWFSKIFSFSKEQTPTPADGAESAASQVDVGRTIPADAGRTALASPPIDPHPILPAEALVAVEWKVGDLILDLYEVKEIHEGGGMGLVYRVHHRGWNTDLAVKSPRRHYFRTEAQKENFTRECETWINLGLHPHIVSCYYVRTLGGVPRVFAEYIEGGSLKEWIDSRRLYEGGPQGAFKRILDIAIQTAWGLQYAHQQGLIHQDVKPANVLLMPDGTAKITDFGLAKARAAVGESVVAGAGRSLLVSTGGMTPAYCSPEQANNEPLSRQTDIWSWAVSVLEMLAGEVCWQSGIAAPELLKHLDDVRVAGVGIPEPPPELLKLLEQCFAAAPGLRPENFGVVSDSLKTIYRTLAREDYARELPEAAEIQADALNNRAVSMLDLGRGIEAEKIFDQALAKDPGHPQATYNRGLRLWRGGRVTDDVIVKALEQSRTNRPGDWNVPFLLGLIHIERRDVEAAVAILSAAEKLKSSAEIRQALGETRRMESGAAKCLRSFDGHTDSVWSVALSTDGRWALSGSKDKTVRLWDVSSGKCLKTLDGHTHYVSSVVLSRDGRWALSGSWDSTLRLWDVSSGKCLRAFKGHTGYVLSVVLSGDGGRALSGSGQYKGSDNTLRLWDVSSGECLQTFLGHTGSVNSVALDVDSRWALSGSEDRTLRLWDVSSGKCLRTFTGHTSAVCSVALSADGRWALSGSKDKTLRLWDVTSGNCLKAFQGHTRGVFSIALSPDGRWAVSASWDETLRLWDVSGGKCLRTFEEPSSVSVSGTVTLAHGLALSGGGYKTFRLWDLRGLRDESQTPIAPMMVCRLASSNETLIVQHRFQTLLTAAEKALSEGEFARAWSLAVESKDLAGYQFSPEALDIARKAGLRGKQAGLRSGWCARSFEGDIGKVNSVVLSGDGHLALSGGADGILRLWEVNTGRCIRTFAGHTSYVHSVALSADGRFALSGSWDTTLRLWDVSTGKCVRSFAGHTDYVNSVTLSADGCWALSGSEDKTLRLWEVSSGNCVRIFKGHADKVHTVALSVDGRLALSGSGDMTSGSGDQTLRLWEVRSGKCLRTFNHTDQVYSVALSADGRRALSGDWMRALHLWDVSSGECLRTFQGHTRPVLSVALSADGCSAVSGSGDNTLRLWDLSTGEWLRTFEGYTDSVSSVALSADGRWALSGSVDKTVRLWELEWDYEFPDQDDWNEGARPHLENFLSVHTPYVSTDPGHPDFLVRRGRATWNDQEWLSLLRTLQHAGYGWLRADGIGRELEKMNATWQGPPPLPWEVAK